MKKTKKASSPAKHPIKKTFKKLSAIHIHYIRVISVLSLIAAVLGVLSYQHNTQVLGITDSANCKNIVTTGEVVNITVMSPANSQLKNIQVWSDGHKADAKQVTLCKKNSGKDNTLVGSFKPTHLGSYTFSTQSDNMGNYTVSTVGQCGSQRVTGKKGETFVSLNLNPTTKQTCTVTFTYTQNSVVSPTKAQSKKVQTTINGTIVVASGIPMPSYAYISGGTPYLTNKVTIKNGTWTFTPTTVGTYSFSVSNTTHAKILVKGDACTPASPSQFVASKDALTVAAGTTKQTCTLKMYLGVQPTPTPAKRINAF